MEKFFSIFPVKIDPILSVGYVLVLAYLPQFYKRGFVVEKLKKEGKQYTIATSRLSGTLAIDTSKEGVFIANLSGCHQNGLEAFSYYAAAIAMSLIAKVPNSVLSGAAGLFVTARVLYSLIYASELNGFPRTVAWTVGVVTSVGLIFIASQHANANAIPVG